MFCPICGNELQENEIHCSKCGAKAGSAPASQGTDPFLKLKENFCDGLSAIKEIRFSFFGGVLLLIVSAFLLGSEKLKVSYTSFSAISRTFTMFEGHETLKNFLIVGYLIAAAAILLPLLTSKPWKKVNFLLGICIPVVSLVYFLVTLIQTRSEYGELARAADLSVTLTFSGWIFLLVSLAAAIFAYSTSKFSY